MSKKQLEAFYQKLQEDKALKDKVAALRGDIASVYGEMAKIARDAGYDITVEDIKAAHAEKGDLDDADLDKLAGGFYGDDWGCSSVCAEVCGNFLGHWVGRQ